MTDETAQPVMIPYATHLEVVAEHLRQTAPVEAASLTAAAAEITALRDALDKETKGQYSQLMLDAADAISAARHMRTVEIPEIRARAEAAEADAARLRERIDTLQEAWDIVRRVTDAAPGLPLEVLPPDDLAKWTDAIITVMKNAAAEHLTRDAAMSERK
jgi:hypothetical protein